MKKLFMILCCLVLVFMPMTVRAAEKEKVKVYIFYGDGCPHCHRAFEFFKSIDEEYGKYYKLVKYETWYSSSNNKMLVEVAEKMGSDLDKLGVPYIVIGDKVFEGYTEEYDEDIKKAIKEAYETNWMSTVGANINEVEKLAANKIGCKYAVALVIGNDTAV